MISEKLKMLKASKGLTTKEIAEISKVPESTVNRILSGETEQPSFQAVVDIIKAMDGSVDSLVGIKPKECPQDYARELEAELRQSLRTAIEYKNKWITWLFLVLLVLLAFLFFGVLPL